MSIRLMIVDDHPVVLEGLSHALSTIVDFEVVACARSIGEARDFLAMDCVDVAIVDVRLPDGNGTLLIDGVRATVRPAFIVLSSFDQAPYVAAAIRAGARGFLMKTAPLDEISASIRRVAAGGTTFTAAQLATMRSPEVALTPRERDVIELVLSACSNDEIAARLGVSRKTVEAYLTRLFTRFGAITRTELAVRATRDGWLDR